MRCDTGTLGVKKSLEVALTRVVTEFGGREFRLGWMHRALPFEVKHLFSDPLYHFSQARTPWRRELEAQGFARPFSCALRQNALQRPSARTGKERAVGTRWYPYYPRRAILHTVVAWEGLRVRANMAFQE